jgi:hypothetical protein
MLYLLTCVIPFFFDMKNKSRFAAMFSSSETSAQVLVAKPCHGMEVTECEGLVRLFNIFFLDKT